MWIGLYRACGDVCAAVQSGSGAGAECVPMRGVQHGVVECRCAEFVCRRYGIYRDEMLDICILLEILL